MPLVVFVVGFITTSKLINGPLIPTCDIIYYLEWKNREKESRIIRTVKIFKQTSMHNCSIGNKRC